MSTGENINANGMKISQQLLRFGFTAFPQSVEIQVNPAQWPQIAPVTIAQGYPFKASQNPAVPVGQAWFVGKNGELLGRIVSIGR